MSAPVIQLRPRALPPRPHSAISSTCSTASWRQSKNPSTPFGVTFPASVAPRSRWRSRRLRGSRRIGGGLSGNGCDLVARSCACFVEEKMSETICPWDYVLEPAPGALTVPNLPDPGAAELGSHLARFVDVEERERVIRGEPLFTRCVDCAFRAGSIPNATLTTVMTALKCSIEHEEFSCHHALDGEGNPTRPCAGWLTLEGAK
jgi:hypothetical protein